MRFHCSHGPMMDGRQPGGNPSPNIHTLSSNFPKMYGPPHDCKGKVKADRQVCANVFGLYLEIRLSWP